MQTLAFKTGGTPQSQPPLRSRTASPPLLPIFGAILTGLLASSTFAAGPNGTSLRPPHWSTYHTAYNPAWFNLGNFPTGSMNGTNVYGTATALTGTIDTPGDDTQWVGSINQGVAGYARSASPTKGSVGVLGVGMSNAQGTSQWGLNAVATNYATAGDNASPGHNMGQTIAGEFDVYIHGHHLAGEALGVKIVGALDSVPSGGAYGLEIAPANVPGTLGWSAAISIDDSPNDTAISVGAAMVSGSTESQSIRFKSTSGIKSPVLSTIKSDLTGTIIFAPGVIKLSAVKFAQLPPCSGGDGAGIEAFITDSDAPISAWHQRVSAGGGSSKAFVACNGTGWFVYAY